MSGDGVFQTRAAAIGKTRSPTVDRFNVGTANMSDDHDRSRCLDGRSLVLCRSTDRYARASPCRHYIENSNLIVDSLRRPQPATSEGHVVAMKRDRTCLPRR